MVMISYENYSTLNLYSNNSYVYALYAYENRFIYVTLQKDKTKERWNRNNN